MKLVILRSVKTADSAADGECVEFDTRYAERVIGNLRNEKGFCASCGTACKDCRAGYGRNFSADICVVELPGVLPAILERPAEHVPSNLPRHDVLLAIHIHGQALIEILKRCAEFGTRAVIAPIEAPDWVPGAIRTEARRLCAANKVEIAFPKPFCSFNSSPGSVLSEFRRYFHIGRPEIIRRVENGKIVEARVEVSAPCGATYYIAHGLIGKAAGEKLDAEIARRLSCYPCTASSMVDPQLGDSIMHHATHFHI